MASHEEKLPHRELLCSRWSIALTGILAASTAIKCASTGNKSCSDYQLTCFDERNAGWNNSVELYQAKHLHVVRGNVMPVEAAWYNIYNFTYIICIYIYRPTDGDNERSSSIETAAIAHMVLHPACQSKQLLYADQISFYADRICFYADRNSLYAYRSIFVPIAAAFTTIEAASLPVEAMDHLEHSREQVLLSLTRSWNTTRFPREPMVS